MTLDISRPVPLSTLDPQTIESWISEDSGRTLEEFATTFPPKPVPPPCVEFREGRFSAVKDNLTSRGICSSLQYTTTTRRM